MYLPFIVGVWCKSLFSYSLLCVLPSFAIFLTRKRELVAVVLLSFRCLVTVNVLLHLLTVPWAGLQCVIKLFCDQTPFPFSTPVFMIPYMSRIQFCFPRPLNPYPVLCIYDMICTKSNFALSRKSYSIVSALCLYNTIHVQDLILIVQISPLYLYTASIITYMNMIQFCYFFYLFVFCYLEISINLVNLPYL